MTDGRWQMADGRWQMADGDRWQMVDGREIFSFSFLQFSSLAFFLYIVDPFYHSAISAILKKSFKLERQAIKKNHNNFLFEPNSLASK